MAEARAKVQWNHTASILALIANCHRDPKKRPRPFTFTDFHPNPPKRTRRVDGMAPISILKTVFVEGGELPDEFRPSD